MLSIESIRQSLADDRLGAYATADDKDAIDSIARYVWNIALGQAMQPALHFLEICLRNHIFEASQLLLQGRSLRFDTVHCWLDATPSLLAPKEREAVEDVKLKLIAGKKPLTPGRLVSRLGLGFWISLCKRPYEQGNSAGPALWPALAINGFPFMKKQMRSRSKIFEHLDKIRFLRNRISHHEPIWDLDTVNAHTKTIEAIAWMNLNLANTIMAESHFKTVFTNGPAAYRGMVSRHVRLGRYYGDT